MCLSVSRFASMVYTIFSIGFRQVWNSGDSFFLLIAMRLKKITYICTSFDINTLFYVKMLQIETWEPAFILSGLGMP